MPESTGDDWAQPVSVILVAKAVMVGYNKHNRQLPRELIGNVEGRPLPDEGNLARHVTLIYDLG